MISLPLKLKKIFTLFKIIISFFVSLISPFFFIIIIIIKPFVIIRITPVRTERYGHLVFNLSNYNSKIKKYKGSTKYFDLFFTNNLGISNIEVLKILKKRNKIYPYYFLKPIYLLFEKIYKYENIHTIPFFSIYDRQNQAKSDQSMLELASNQNNKCEDILKNNGLNINSFKYVCIFNRDDAYLNSFTYKRDNYNLSHHNYNIKSFTLAANKLADKDIYVFRMGKVVEDKFNLNNPKIIDYANSSFQSDLMDIYLASNCLFGISCGTGSSAITITRGKPILDLNANLHHLCTFQEDSILLSKHYYSKEKKRNLTLKEILNYELDETPLRSRLDKEQIEMLDCSPEEIADAALETLDRLKGEWVDTDEIIELQKNFKNSNWKNIKRILDIKYRANDTIDGQPDLNNISPGSEVQYYHDDIKAKYSSNFLINNKDWLK